MGYVGPADANSIQTTALYEETTWTWVAVTDIQPTMMYLTGLTDDHVPDVRVITELLGNPYGESHSSQVAALGACYKGLNSSVGEFGKDPLEAGTAAIEGTSTCDGTYFSVVSLLSVLDQDRDQLAGAMKSELEVSEFQNHSDYCFARSDRGLSVTHQQGGGPRSVARCSGCRGTPCGGIGRPVG